MQLQKWTVVNRRWFAPESRSTRKQWAALSQIRRAIDEVLKE